MDIFYQFSFFFAFQLAKYPIERKEIPEKSPKCWHVKWKEKLT